VTSDNPRIKKKVADDQDTGIGNGKIKIRVIKESKNTNNKIYKINKT
jgi:hypothetical protein